MAALGYTTKKLACQQWAMMSLGIIVDRLRSVGRWTKLRAVFTEWWHRIRFRYELEPLTGRELADMGMTRTDAFNETQKPFWEP
jgi:uncharacterized protein YjiS (DUF1127 family)